MRLATIAVLLLAHNDPDAAWIAGIKNKQGESCCGPSDCKKVDPDKVRRVPGGYEVTYTGRVGVATEFIPRDDAMTSKDGNVWVCENTTKRVCFFVPAETG